MVDVDKVEMYINDELIYTIAGSGPYIFIIEWSRAMKTCIFKFVFYGFGGDTAVVIIDRLDIKSYSSIRQISTGSSSQIDTIGFILMPSDNNLPYAPSNYYPCGWPPVDIDVNLSWDGDDPDHDDTVTYYEYFDIDSNPSLNVFEAIWKA